MIFQRGYAKLKVASRASATLKTAQPNKQQKQKVNQSAPSKERVTVKKNKPKTVKNYPLSER